MKAQYLILLSVLWTAAGHFVGSTAIAGGPVFSDTGANVCGFATVVPVEVGPVGSPLTVTIMGDNSTATGPDCVPPAGIHVGPVWWEAFQITQRALVTIDMCGTEPVQDPSYDIIYQGCAVPQGQTCVNPNRSDESGRGAPFCTDGNLWATYANLAPGTYRIPVLSDPSVLVGGLGPYVIHIHASACPGSCCHASNQSCDDCADPATCTSSGDAFHADQTCAEVECAAVAGPDLVVGAVWECKDLGRVGEVGAGTVAMSCRTTACNKGDQRGNWIALPNTDHPVIGVNLYRMETVAGATRFEQLGYSWLKHGFGSANADECGFGCVPGAAFEEIGIGCSDSYNAVQFEPCNLGPRSMMHPYTGVMPGGPDMGVIPDCGPSTSDDHNYPSNDHRDHVHTPISHKVQVQEVDLDANVHPNARYFAEGFYIAPHEFNEGNGNQNNNYSHLEVTVSGPDILWEYTYTPVGNTNSESPAVDAWTGASQSVIEPTPLADGRAIAAWQATDLGGGQWHYDYAINNLNLDQSIGSLCIPLATGVNISNVGFHAPLHHAPEPHADNYSNDPWVPTVTANAIRWDTGAFHLDPLANAVRFGTLYNFRFDADVAPQAINGVVGLFKTNGFASVALQGPSPAAPVDVNGNGVPDGCEPVIPSVPVPDPVHPTKTRFISFSVPPSGDAGPETALQVRLVSLHHVSPPYTGGPSTPFTSFEGQVRWVGEPNVYLEGGGIDSAFFASQLQCSPYYQDWSALESPWAWEGLHVTGSGIVPSSTYEVRNVAASCKGSEAGCTAVSGAMMVSTGRWGDVKIPYNPPDPSIQPDISDVSALVDKFRNAMGSPSKTRGILAGAPGNPFGEVTLAVLSVDFGFSHISACVDAFRGVPYPYTISACP